MNDLEPSNSIKSKKLMEILDDIKQEGDLKGVLYSYRDGQLIKENFEEVFDIDLCSSMCASISESAQGLAKNLNEKRVPKIIAELENQSIIIFECDEKTFLTLFLKRESKVSPILENIENYIRKIIFLY